MNDLFQTPSHSEKSVRTLSFSTDDSKKTDGMVSSSSSREPSDTILRTPSVDDYSLSHEEEVYPEYQRSDEDGPHTPPHLESHLQSDDSVFQSEDDEKEAEMDDFELNFKENVRGKRFPDYSRNQ